MNSAWGLGLDNLYYLLDWNDYGIDDHRVSDAVYGTPTDWFASHGWRVVNTEEGSEWEPVLRTVLELTEGEHERQAPSIAWFKTRKGRGYLKYDNASHGVPHKRNSELFWETKESFTQKYGVEFANFGGAAPDDYKGVIAEFEANLRVVMDFLREDQALVDYLADRLVEIGESVPLDIGGFRLGKQGNPFDDPALYDFEQYPADLFAKPGEMAPNRAALSKWGAWANAFGATKYGRPLFLISSADLAGSTNINGFANGYGDFEGYGWYERYGTDEGVLLPQEITEFANSGIMAGIATVNLAEDPERNFDGFWAASSTYGSFSYLMYGLMRLFSQLAQDCQLKVGKTLWIAGHSGPETADDSRTHFGIFGPGVTQLFPEGHIINLHPWEHNEVPVLLGAALKTEVPIVGLHLTRPPVEIPDRTRLGIPSHFEAVRGAYVVRDYAEGMPHGGAFIVQGTSTMANIVKILPQLDEKKLNVKIVYAASPQLFARQPAEYRERVITAEDRVNSTVITTQARWLMHDWLFNKVSEEYALSADWDDRWRTGGNLEDVIEEAQLSPEWIVNGMQKFVDEKGKRLEQLASDLEAAST
jgi:transketolase